MSQKKRKKGRRRNLELDCFQVREEGEGFNNSNGLLIIKILIIQTLFNFLDRLSGKKERDGKGEDLIWLIS